MEVRNLFTSSFDMIRFYLKSVLFILLIITILMVLNRLYISTDRYLTYNKTKDFLNISEGYDFVNFGTSHAQFAIDYSTVDKKGFNFALPSQPLLYDNALLSEYNDKFSKDLTAIIVISPFSLFYDLSENKIKELSAGYYRILSRDNIPFFEWSKWIMYRLFPVISAKRELWAIISDEIDVAERKYRVKEKNLYSEENLKKIAKKRAKSHLNRCNIEFLERNLVGLNIIIGRLRQMEAKIIIVIPPFTKYYYNEFSDVYKQIMNDTLMDVSKNHKIIFKDYSEDKRFYENIDLFADSDHLNKSGRKLFTKILFEECIFDR